MTQKRIKAIKRNITNGGDIWRNPHPDAEPCYVLRQSDIRALAEQFLRDADKFIMNPKSRCRERMDTALHCFKRAGMAPGRKGGAK